MSSIAPDPQNDGGGVPVDSPVAEPPSAPQSPFTKLWMRGMLSSIRLFAALRIPVYVHWSWFLVAIIEIVRARNHNTSYSHPLFWSVAEYMGLFVIVLLHEFGHALACRSVGGQVERIVLWPLGGLAMMTPPQRPGAILWSVAAGPLVNVLLVPVILVCNRLTAGGPHDANEFCDALMEINAGLLIFNVLPIYPLDGGRMLHALLWFSLGRARGFLIAGSIGVVGAIGLGIVAWFDRGWILGIMAVIGGFVGVCSVISGWSERHEPDRRYARLRRMFRQNRAFLITVVVMTAVILLPIAIVGGLGIGWQREAITNLTAQKDEAERKADVSAAVARFEGNMLSTADPDHMLGDKVTLLETAQKAVKQLDAGSLKDQPLAEVAVREAIGEALRSLRRDDVAEPVVRRALEIRRKVLSAGDPGIRKNLMQLGSVLAAQKKFAEAEPFFREELAMRRKATPAAAPFDIARNLDRIGWVIERQSRFAEAEPFFREELGILRKGAPAPAPSEIATCLVWLGSILRQQNKFAEAEPLLSEALDIRRNGVPAAPPLEIAQNMDWLAAILEDQGKLAEAEPLFRESLDIRRKAVPAADPFELAANLEWLGTLLWNQNRLAEAEPLFREAEPLLQQKVANYRKTLARDDLDLASAILSLGRTEAGRGKHTEAEPLLREALAIRLKKLGPDAHSTKVSAKALADFLNRRVKVGQAK